jgi:hypothetical protein
MIEKSFIRWPLQPSTVIGLGILAGTTLYSLTGDPVWAGAAAAAVKILVPDNTGNADVLGAIGAIAAVFGRTPTIKSDSDI